MISNGTELQFLYVKYDLLLHVGGFFILLLPLWGHKTVNISIRPVKRSHSYEGYVIIRLNIQLDFSSNETFNYIQISKPSY